MTARSQGCHGIDLTAPLMRPNAGSSISMFAMGASETEIYISAGVLPDRFMVLP